jgi:hypothetical protein
MMLDSFYKRRRAFVIEPRSINQCLIFRKPKQSRSRIPRLRMQRNSPCFDETEAQRRKRPQRDTVFIEPGCEADGI